MREATDLGVSAGVRRELSGRRIDLTKLKFPVKSGIITIQGELSFVGIVKTTEETAIELKFIESSLKSIHGSKEVIFELTNWAKNETGTWESSEVKTASVTGLVSTGEGLTCPDCDYVFRFCPCCGKPLSGTAKHPTSRTKRPIPPVKPVIKKKRILPATPLAPKVSEPQESEKETVLPKPTIPEVPQPFSPVKKTDDSINLAAPPAAKVAPLKPDISTTPFAASPPVEKAFPTPNEANSFEQVQPVQESPLTVEPAVPELKLDQLPTPVESAPAQSIQTPPVPSLEPEIASAPIETAPGIDIPEPISPMPADNLMPEPQVPVQEPSIQTPAAPAPDDQSAGISDLNLNMLNLEQPPEPEVQQFAPPVPEPIVAPSVPAPAAATPVPDMEQFDLSDFTLPVEPVTPATNETPSEPAIDPFAPIGASDLNIDLDETPLPPMKPATKPPSMAGLDLGDFAAPTLEIDDETPLPPMKPAAPQAKDSFSLEDEETPLPPMKPAAPQAHDPFSLEDEETPLPPMKPKAPEKPASKDPFAALFSDSNLGLSGDGSKGKDPFSSLDLDLDVLEVFPPDSAATPPPATAAPAKPPTDDNPFNFDNVIDLDSPIDNGSEGKKDPFDLDDFDISKFKI